MRTHFNVAIQYFPCDNGREFDNTPFRIFFDTHGISFRFSYPNTSQKNGKVERIIHTLNNMVRNLLFQAHLLVHYWVEALYMNVHLLNILPTKALNNNTPYEALHH